MVGVRSRGQTSFKCNQICGGAKLQRGIGPPYRSGGFGRACSPAPAQCNGNGNGNSWLSVGCRGGVGLRGRRKYVPVGLAAASMPRTPRNPTPPALDTFRRLLVDVDLGRHIGQISNGIPGDRSVFQRKADLTPRDAPAARGKLSKAGWARWRECPRHGCRGQAPMDGFRASPATGPTPPSLRKPAFDVDVALASAGAGRSPAERTPYLNRPFCARSQPSVRLGRSAAAVRFPPGPPATRVRPLRPPPLRRRSSRIPAGASCRLHPTSRSAVHGNAPSQPITLICPRLSVRTGVSCTWSNLNVF